MMEKNLKWNKQQDLDDENQKTTHNIEFKKKANTPCSNGPLFLECCKGRNGYGRKIKLFQKLREVEVKQFRIIVNGYFCKAPEKFCFVIINGKKIQFIQGADGTNFLIQQIILPMIKRKPNFPQAFLLRNGLLKFPVFQPIC